MIILSADPGYEKFGVAVIENKNGRDALLFSSCLKTSPKDKYFQRVARILESLERIMDQYKPEVLAIEKVFFTTNQKTAMRVSEIKGAAIGAALKRGLDVHEFTPLEVKGAVTGHGKADKGQVIDMVRRLVSIGKEIKEDDEYDAIAVGLTFSASHKSLVNGS